MPFILPKGNYYDGGPHVAEGSTPVAIRPSKDYTLTTNWASDPLIADVVWRKKTREELAIESDDEFDIAVNTSPILKALFDELEDMHTGLRSRVKRRVTWT